MAKKHNTKQEKQPQDEQKPNQSQSSFKAKSHVSWIVFLFTLAVVLLSLISVVFPALLVSANSSNLSTIRPAGPDPYETGFWAVPFFAANIIVFFATALYYTNKLPEELATKFTKLFSFEISNKVAFIVLVILLGIYISATAQELATEEKWEDYLSVKKRAETWTLDAIPTSTEPHVKYFLLSASKNIFGNLAVIPFLASISLLITTYFLVKKITNKRFAGVVSVVIILQSTLFLNYDTTVAYDNFWILFYLVSLYLIYKFWPLSPISYLLALPSKAMTVLFLPMSIFFFLRSKVSKTTKVIVCVACIVIVLSLYAVVSSRGISFVLAGGQQEEFSSKEFWMGFTSFAYQMRFDGLVILFILPLIVGLFVAARHGINHAESIMVLISGILLIAPILTGYTDQTNQPYRFVPLVVFFAVGVGTLLSKKAQDL